MNRKAVEVRGLTPQTKVPYGTRYEFTADIKAIEAGMTVTGGKIVYGAGDFADLVNPLPDIQPVWSPVRDFGSYQKM